MMRAMLMWSCLLVGTASAQETTEEAPPPAPPEVTEAEALAPLEAAFQKEFAYLSAERDALERRITAQQKESNRSRAEADAALDRLQARLTALQVQVEQKSALLEDVDRRAQTAREADDALSSAWFQMKNTVGTTEAPLPEPEDTTYAARAAAMAVGFARGAELLADGRTVRVVQGTWFERDGDEVESDLLEVGNIATFGIGTESAALMPVGEGRLQGHREGVGTTATALLDGTPQPTMGLFLHEGRTKRIDERDPKTLQDILEAGGTVGYVIVGLGLLALVLMVGRTLTLATAARDAAKVDAAVAAVEEGQYDQALAAVDGATGTAAHVVSDLVPHLEGTERTALEDIASAALLKETPRVERFGAAILVIAAVAPLLGLLGTVTGMIATFDIITEFGTGDPRMLSGGISAALVTTQFGLIVAIPALLGGNLLSGWGDTVMDDAENAALRILNALETGDGNGSTTQHVAQASK